MKCDVATCDRPVKARVWCGRHYENWRMTGDPIPRVERPDSWYLSRIVVVESGCWEYQGKRKPAPANYGVIREKHAHRVAWEAASGPIPTGLIVRHKCDNPPCVNPDHLEIGTTADNMRDKVERGRHHYHGMTHCLRGHEFPPDRPVGTQPRCLICQRRAQRDYKARQKAKV